MSLNSEIPLVALLGLVHVRIPLPVFVLGGAGRRDQGGIDDRALSHRHPLFAEVSLDGLKDLLSQAVLLKKVPVGQDRGLIRDQVADEIDAGKAAHDGHLNQGLFHGRIAEGVSLLQEMDPQHCGQRIGRPVAFLAHFGVVGSSRAIQRLPGGHRHLRESSPV